MIIYNYRVYNKVYNVQGGTWLLMGGTPQEHKHVSCLQNKYLGGVQYANLGMGYAKFALIKYLLHHIVHCNTG